MADGRYQGNKGLEYYKAYPRDFFEGTLGMPGQLRGFYRMALDLIYMHDGFLLNDWGHIAGLTGYGKTQCKRMMLQLVDMGKIEVSGENDEFFTQKRAKNELKDSRKFQENQSKKAAKRWKNNDLPDAADDAEPMPPQDHKTTRHKSPSDSGAPNSMPLFGGQAKSKPKPPDRFEEFWNTYPHRGGAKKGKAAARKKWDAALKRKVDPSIIIAGAVDFQRDRKVVDGYAPDPARWLHNEMWLDEIEEVKGQGNGNRFENGGSGGGAAGTRRPTNGGHHDALLAGFGQAALNVERGTRSDGFGHSEDFHASHAAGDRGQGGADPE